MNPRTYHFDEQLAIEAHWKDRYLKLLDRHGIRVEELDHLGIQRLGVDAIVHMNDWRHSIEFKTDFKAQRTGNFFVETVSHDVNGVPGWAYTSTAQLLGLYLIGLERLLLIPMWDLKQRLSSWSRTYPTRSCQNPTYRSHGVLVPLPELEAISVRILEERPGEDRIPGTHQAEDEEDPARRQVRRAARRAGHHRL